MGPAIFRPIPLCILLARRSWPAVAPAKASVFWGVALTELLLHGHIEVGIRAKVGLLHDQIISALAPARRLALPRRFTGAHCSSGTSFHTHLHSIPSLTHTLAHTLTYKLSCRHAQRVPAAASPPDLQRHARFRPALGVGLVRPLPRKHVGHPAAQPAQHNAQSSRRLLRRGCGAQCEKFGQANDREAAPQHCPHPLISNSSLQSSRRISFFSHDP